MQKKSFDRLPVIFLFFLSIFIFSQNLNIHGLGFRDDEVFYVHSTQEMLKTSDYLSPTYFGDNRFQKPILFYWFIVAFYKLFGVSWQSARLVSVVFAALAVCLTWLLAKKIYNDRRLAYLSAIILMSTPMFYRHAQNAVPDMAMNSFIVLAMYFFVRFLKSSHQMKYSYLFFISCALGFMVKGFAAWIIPLGTVFLYAGFNHQWVIIRKLNFLKGSLIVSAIVLPWFVYMISRHGISYLEYMAVDETQNRLLGWQTGNFIVIHFKIFVSNVIFYLRVLGTLFFPWSLFGLLAIPIFFFKKDNKNKFGFAENKLFSILWLWIGLVFCFFSFMSFSIHHYTLVLSTPLSIGIAYILLYPVSDKLSMRVFFLCREALLWLSLGCILFLMILFCVVFSTYYIAAGLLFCVGCAALFVRFFVIRNFFFTPVFLGVLLLIGVSQMQLLDKQGLTAHSKLVQFAQTIREDSDDEYMVAVGSHDLHEKEFQVYLDRPVQTAGNDRPQIQSELLRMLFSEPKTVYCLIKSEDYINAFKKIKNYKLEILKRDYIVRKRVKLDGNFMKALLQLDREKIYSYFMEEVLLVRKDVNVRN